MKYMGSKSRIKKYILPILQNIIDTCGIEVYIEPFCGGCNIIDEIKCKNRIASDKSSALIGLWKGLQSGDTLYEYVDFELYSDARDNINSGKYSDFQLGNIGFLASYNGRYFDGGYARPSKGRVYYEEAKRNIEAQVNSILDVKFFNKDYLELTNANGALIYCDIPYKNTKQYNTSKGFDHDKFYDWARGMSSSNIVVISELNAPDDFVCIWQQEVLRSIKATDKSVALEKLFIHKSLLQRLQGDR